MKDQKGFTIVELILTIFGLVGWLIYALIHFILKAW